MKQIVPFLLMLATCTKAPTNDLSSTIIPVNTNQVWVYYDSSFTLLEDDHRFDTLILTATITVDGKQIHMCTTNKPMKFGVDFNALRVDSNSIYLVNTIYQTESLFFRKTSSIDTVSVNDYYYSTNLSYVPLPLPDALIEIEKIKGVEYHIAHPQQIEINGRVCYKNERVAVDIFGNELSKQAIYVSPDRGIVKVEFFARTPGIWFPYKKMVRGTCLNLWN